MAASASEKAGSHHSHAEEKPKETCNRVVYNIPYEWIEAMKENNIPFSPFVKSTIRKELAKMNILHHA